MTGLARPLAVKLVATSVALVLAAVVWSGGTWSAFDLTATSPHNSVAAGSVIVADNDGGTALFAMTGAVVGTSATSCETVSYSGSAPATVRLLATTGGTGLAPYLTLTITRGTIAGTPAPRSCTNFVADTTNYVGAGAGVISSGPLASFPSTTGTALADPSAAAPATWATGDAHAYKLVVTMSSAAGAGRTATASFTWSAISA